MDEPCHASIQPSVRSNAYAAVTVLRLTASARAQLTFGREVAAVGEMPLFCEPAQSIGQASEPGAVSGVGTGQLSRNWPFAAGANYPTSPPG